jgi:hypothetical protein
MEKINIKEILEREGEVRKFVGVAPEGFVLIHEKTLEDLKDFDIWKEWKNGNLKLQDLDKKNFE